jgi:phosphoribosylformylglycinamidine synthase subunit PurQ / glutaminase
VKFGVVVFPGGSSDRDCGWVVEQVLRQELVQIWHRDTDLGDVDCVILPGGASYGDHLRCGALARSSPVIGSIREFAERGGPVWGIGNGFQILCEAGLLPGALVANSSGEFQCDWVTVVCEQSASPFTGSLRPGQVLRLPISHGEGNYQADAATKSFREQQGQVAFRYCDPEGRVTTGGNPNGSTHNIAGIVSKQGNVLGMMPHPERSAEPEVGGEDGRLLFESLLGATSAQTADVS